MIELKPIIQTDLEMIEKLEIENYPNPYSLKILEDTINNKIFVCNKLIENNKIIGYFFVFLTVDKLEIVKITVTKTHQGKGYGEFLLVNIIKIAENNHCNEILLEVNETNHKALKLYKKYGFKSLSRIENYYGNYGSAFLMAKKI